MSDARRDRLVVIDAANALYRAFFAIPHLRSPDGEPTNALYGFATMLNKALREERPTHIAVARDPRGGSFRNELYPEYKAGRDAQPEDLSTQLPWAWELCETLGVTQLEVPGFEADDVIATLVEKAPEGTEVVIVSTDKDLMQLVGSGVELLDTMKGKRIDAEAVEARFGVPPEKLLDVRALVGDPSDNIPGVKGIGEKGAAKLILEWGDLDALLEGAEQVKAKRAREGLLEHADEARLSRKLSSLERDVPLPVDWEGLRVPETDPATLRAFYERFGFTRLIEALDAAAPTEADAAAESLPNDSPAMAVTEVVRIDDEAALDAALAGWRSAEAVALAPVVEGQGAMGSRLHGLALSVADQKPVYVVIAGESLLDREGVAAERLAEALSDVVGEGAGTGWIAHDCKRLHSLLTRAGLTPAEPRLDVGIAAALLDYSGSQDLASLARAELGRPLGSWEELAGRGAKAKAVVDLDPEAVARFGAEQAVALLELAPRLEARLVREGLAELFETVERPLSAVLSRMELAGVRIDEAMLADLSVEFEKELARIEAEIFELAGEAFLISSPKQLQVILFEKLGLPVLKKTKTGYSTAESVLEQLRTHHELPGRVLAWRKLSKLKSTYIDALPPLVDEQTGRIHPEFHQLGAATGRLSSSNPNVQNIPIRGDQGARIREAFIPAEGRVLVSADYSQVELRILAHYSGDASLIDAFRRGHDIHRRTAAEVAGIALEDVTDEQRARAKAVNFGIIYGSSAFGLAQQLDIAAGEAQETIDAYFARYEGVRRFLDETLEQAKKDGSVRTLLGRKRDLPELASRNRALRQGAERMATNTVIQGTAADLIKRAMVAVDGELAAAGLDATLMLQVHDELVFEVTEAHREALQERVVRCMEGVAALAVPLTVEVGFGRNWREAH